MFLVLRCNEWTVFNVHSLWYVWLTERYVDPEAGCPAEVGLLASSEPWLAEDWLCLRWPQMWKSTLWWTLGLGWLICVWDEGTLKAVSCADKLMAWLSSSNNDRVTLKLGGVTAVKQRLLAEIKRERRPIHELICSRYSLQSALIPHTYQAFQTKGSSQSRFSHLRSSQT